MLHSLSLSPFSSSSSITKPFNSHNLSSSSSHPPPSLYIKFRTSHLVDLRYLKSIGVIDPNTKPNKLPSNDAISHILTTVNFFKSRGFQDSDFARLAYHCPQLFSFNFDITEIEPVFDFLTSEVQASVQESRGLVVNCPQLLFSDVEYCLRPTLDYLTRLGVRKLNIPRGKNAHLLNTRVEKLRPKLKFLRSIGLSHEEAASFCAKLPAIFGYSIDNNLRPKFVYLVEEMDRSLEELKKFPTYFAFSLQKRIIPRHLYLKERKIRLRLPRMLIFSDEKFYAIWK